MNNPKIPGFVCVSESKQQNHKIIMVFEMLFLLHNPEAQT
jgi:hypothetical protein